MKRKEFIQKSSAAVFLASIGYTLQSCSEDEDPGPTNSNVDAITIDLSSGDFSALGGENGWVLHPDENLLLANVGGEIMIFSSVCPHSGCARDWGSSSNQFVCTCHNSVFTYEGDLVSGPATRGLTARSYTREGDIITLG